MLTVCCRFAVGVLSNNSQAAAAASTEAGMDSRPPRPFLELVELYLDGGVFRSLWNLLEVWAVEQSNDRGGEGM